MQDNDSKHTSTLGKDDHGVNWWHTRSESPDLNPTENLWHELKEFIRRKINPKTKDELINGILRFWEIVDFIKCDLLRKNQPLALKCDFAVGGSILDSTFFRFFLFVPWKYSPLLIYFKISA